MSHHVLTVSQGPGGARDIKNETLKLDLIALPQVPTFYFRASFNLHSARLTIGCWQSGLLFMLSITHLFGRVQLVMG